MIFCQLLIIHKTGANFHHLQKPLQHFYPLLPYSNYRQLFAHFHGRRKVNRAANGRTSPKSARLRGYCLHPLMLTMTIWQTRSGIVVTIEMADDWQIEHLVGEELSWNRFRLFEAIKISNYRRGIHIRKSISLTLAPVDPAIVELTG